MILTSRTLMAMTIKKKHWNTMEWNIHTSLGILSLILRLKVYLNNFCLLNNLCYILFIHKVFLTCFVFKTGYISGRDPKQGSIFIQALCKELNQHWSQQDLSTIASYVNRSIMREFSFQAPEIVNQLGDLVFFRPWMYYQII